MAQHDPIVPIPHMLDHALEAVALTRGRTRHDLDSDRIFELALTQLATIVGEAATRVPSEVRARATDVPWRQIVGLRNRLIYSYDAVDLDILWDVVETELPPLVDLLTEGFPETQ